MGKLNAYLVVTAGFKLYFKPGYVVMIVDTSIRQTGVLTFGWAYDATFALAVGQVMRQLARLWQSAFGQGPVLLVNGAVPNLFGQSGGRLGSSGKDHNAGNGSVKAVYKAKEHIAGLVVLFLQVCLPHVQKVGISGLVALAEHAAGFPNNQQMVVLIQNGKRHEDWLFGEGDNSERALDKGTRVETNTKSKHGTEFLQIVRTVMG